MKFYTETQDVKKSKLFWLKQWQKGLDTAPQSSPPGPQNRRTLCDLAEEGMENSALKRGSQETGDYQEASATVQGKWPMLKISTSNGKRAEKSPESSQEVQN